MSKIVTLHDLECAKEAIKKDALARYVNQVPIVDITGALGVSYAQLHQWRKEAGIPERPQGRINRNREVTDLKNYTPADEPRQPVDKNYVAIMNHLGYNDKLIASVVGVSSEAVRRIIRETPVTLLPHNRHSVLHRIAAEQKQTAKSLEQKAKILNLIANDIKSKI